MLNLGSVSLIPKLRVRRRRRRCVWRLFYDEPMSHDQQSSSKATNLPSSGSFTQSQDSADVVVLRSLAPKYVEEGHLLPLDLLLTAIDQSQSSSVRPRNIALAGPYGSGKSSVLERLVERSPTRTVNISLSTLSTADHESDNRENQKGRVSSTTNHIQKEIVKQLLYRELPSAVPDSRFRRLEPVNGDRTLFLGFCIGLLSFLAASMVGLPILLAKTFFSDIQQSGWVFTLLLAALLGTAAAQIYIQIVRRFDISSVSAAGASVTLANRNSYYFDEFLDEIIYFFQQTTVDVVIFEDLDRFDDPHIYESLRGLNTVLNNSKQLNRCVQFIYAVRDSIFDSKAVERGSRQRVDAVGDRTKFFDLIVPLVPFITDQNALDLFKIEIEGLSDHHPDDAVLQIVAPYVPDMRLLRNIRNEYAVFAHHLLGGDQRLGGLNPQSLMAMVAYKNVAASQFEKIRRHESELDFFFDHLRDGVVGKIADNRSEIRALRSAASRASISTTRAERLLERAQSVLERVFFRVNSQSGTLRSLTADQSGRVWSVAELTTGRAWHDISLSETVTATFKYGFGNSTTNLSFPRSELEDYLDGANSLARVASETEEEIRARIEALTAEISLLRRANLVELLEHATLTLPHEDNQISPRQLQRQVVTVAQKMLLDLMRAGYIDRNYALYSAKYYGKTLSATAMTFVIQHIQPNIGSAFYTFENDADSDALITIYGDTLFDDDAGRNVALVERLCATLNPALKRVTKSLATGEADAREFITAFIEQSEYRNMFFQQLSEEWEGALDYLLSLPGLEPDHTLSLFNAALLGQTAAQATLPPDNEVLDVVRSGLSELPVLTTDIDEGRAATIALQFQKLQLAIDDLKGVEARLQSFLINANAWEVNIKNLLHISGGSTVPTLTDLLARGDTVYHHVMRNLDRYLDALDGENGWALSDPEFIPTIIDDTISSAESQLPRLLDSFAPDAFVLDFEEIPQSAWPAMVTHDRVQLNEQSLTSYLAAFGPDIDEFLVALLERTNFADEPVLPESVAIAILNSPNLTTKRKVDLIRQSAGATYDPALLVADGAATLPTLLGECFADDSTAFAQSILLGVATVTAVAQRSTVFVEYLGELELEDSTLTALLEDDNLNATKKARVIDVAVAQGIPTPAVGALVAGLIESRTIASSESLLIWLAAESLLQSSVVSILVAELDRLDPAGISRVLESLGEVYSDLLVPGRSVRLPKDETHRALLEYLVASGHPVKRYTDAKNWITVYRD